MTREELAALEKDINGELASLTSEKRRLDFDGVSTAGLEREITAITAELAAVKAEQRRVQAQLTALQAEDPRLKEIGQLETEIAAQQKEIGRMTADTDWRGMAAAADSPRQKEVKRLVGEMAVLIVKRNLLKRALRRRERLQQKPACTQTGKDARLRTPMLSLEAPVGRDGESTHGDLIEDGRVGSDVDAVIESNVRDETNGILHTLSPEEEKVIRMRFGIGFEREHSLEEIGQEFDVTRERIRQIEAQALRRLRAPERARRLRSLMAAR